jgi:hypothetical protein
MPGSGWSRNVRRRLIGLLRAALCVGLLAALVLGLALRTARAEVNEKLLGFGAELAAWQSARLHSTPRRLSLNGLELGVVTASSAEGVRASLDRFHTLCKRRGGLAVPAALRDRFPAGLDGVLRQDADEEGFLACLDSGAPLEFEELVRRLEAFADTGDLQALGELRYVFARRSGETTTLLVFWSEGSAPLAQLFPSQGDAPGRDPEGVPRAPGSRRLLSAAEHGAPYSAAVYAIEGQSPEALGAWYREAFEAQGWSLSSGSDPSVLVVRRAERTVLVKVAPARDGRLFVTVSELS